MENKHLCTQRIVNAASCNRRRKQLACPNCGSRLIDEGISTDTELWVVNEGSDYEADYYAKCKTCKKEIGIKKINK